MSESLALPQGYLSPQVLAVTSFANSSVVKNFEQVRKAHLAFEKLAKQFDHLQEQFGNFAKANWREVLKARIVALKQREGANHALLSGLTALVEISRSLLSWLLSFTSQPKSLPAYASPSSDTHRPNAPPLACLKGCANTPINVFLKRGCLQR